MRAAMLLAMSSLVGSVAHAAITTVYVTPEYAGANFGTGLLQLGTSRHATRSLPFAILPFAIFATFAFTLFFPSSSVSL